MYSEGPKGQEDCNELTSFVILAQRVLPSVLIMQL